MPHNYFYYFVSINPSHKNMYIFNALCSFFLGAILRNLGTQIHGDEDEEFWALTNFYQVYIVLHAYRLATQLKDPKKLRKKN